MLCDLVVLDKYPSTSIVHHTLQKETSAVLAYHADWKIVTDLCILY
jgi:hypothetical protein